MVDQECLAAAGTRKSDTVRILRDAVIAHATAMVTRVRQPSEPEAPRADLRRRSYSQAYRD